MQLASQKYQLIILFDMLFSTAKQQQSQFRTFRDIGIPLNRSVFNR